jgi:hypothetical protein
LRVALATAIVAAACSTGETRGDGATSGADVVRDARAPGGPTAGDGATGDAPVVAPWLDAADVGIDAAVATDGGSTGVDAARPRDSAVAGSDVPAVPDATSGGWSAGTRDGSCRAGVPAEGQPVDTSRPTTVVGTGSAASCTFEALRAAIRTGGVVTFNCGRAPVAIVITATIDVPIDRNTVVDGGRLVTLDGNDRVRVLRFNSPGWQTNEHRLTLQHIAVRNARAELTEPIPPASQPACSQGWNGGQGGAVLMRDGNLTVVDAIFSNNHGAPVGPDTGGGAIYVVGSRHGLVIAGSSFVDNAAANGAGVGGLFCTHHIYNSLFERNTATGHDANNVDMARCSVMNNNQYEVGSGGNGGAIYSDGQGVSIVLCGDQIVGNAAGARAFGGGVFFTSNDLSRTLSITDTTITGNTGGHWTRVVTGRVTSAGTAVGTNCRSIAIANSTVQGI